MCFGRPEGAVFCGTVDEQTLKRVSVKTAGNSSKEQEDHIYNQSTSSNLLRNESKSAR